MECSDERYVDSLWSNIREALEEAQTLVRQLKLIQDAFDNFAHDHALDDDDSRFRVPVIAEAA